MRSEMKAAGAWVFAGGLHPPSTATVVRVKDGEVLMTDGPFAEGKEHIGGFTIIKAPDLDAALEWGRQARAGDHAARSKCGRFRARSTEVQTCRAISTLGDRACLPRGVRSRGGRPGPRLRRHRRRRRGGAGRVHRGGGALAATGLPPSPAGWIITTARNRAIDRFRREASRDERHAEAALLYAGRRAGARRVPCATIGCA